jgi:hypothetical protein
MVATAAASFGWSHAAFFGRSATTSKASSVHADAAGVLALGATGRGGGGAVAGVQRVVQQVGEVLGVGLERPDLFQQQRQMIDGQAGGLRGVHLAQLRQSGSVGHGGPVQRGGARLDGRCRRPGGRGHRHGGARSWDGRQLGEPEQAR